MYTVMICKYIYITLEILMHVHSMCWNTPGIYQFTLVYTSFMQNQKICLTARIEPMTSCILASCLNHCATSVLVTVTLLQCISSCSPGPGGWSVRLAQDQQRPPPPSKILSQLCGCTLVPSERFHSGRHVLFNLKVRTTRNFTNILGHQGDGPP